MFLWLTGELSWPWWGMSGSMLLAGQLQGLLNEGLRDRGGIPKGGADGDGADLGSGRSQAWWRRHRDSLQGQASWDEKEEGRP